MGYLLTFNCFVEFLLGRLLNLLDLLKKISSFLASGDGADEGVVKILFKADFIDSNFKSVANVRASFLSSSLKFACLTA